MFLERDEFIIKFWVSRSFSIFWKNIYKQKSVISVFYKQCNLKELLIFIEKSKDEDFSLDNRILSFIKENSVGKVRERELNAIIYRFDKVRSTILNTYFKWCFTNSKNSKKTAQSSIFWENSYESPMEANIAFIAKETWTSIIDLYEKCTIKDIEYLSDAVEWNLNAMWGKKWQRRNRLLAVKRKARNRTPEQLAEIKKKLEKIPEDWKTVHEKVITKL